MSKIFSESEKGSEENKTEPRVTWYIQVRLARDDLFFTFSWACFSRPFPSQLPLSLSPDLVRYRLSADGVPMSILCCSLVCPRNTL